MCRRANCFFQLFSFCDPIVKTFLFQTYCLSLYGACTWKLDCKKLQSLIVAFNNSLRKIWNLPRSTHTGVLHCADLGSIINKIIKISLCHIVFFCFFVCLFFYESLYMMHTGHTITIQLIPVCALLNTTTSI